MFTRHLRSLVCLQLFQKSWGTGDTQHQDMEFSQHFAGAVAVRLFMAGTGWPGVLMDRVDLATPLTSLRRLREDPEIPCGVGDAGHLPLVRTPLRKDPPLVRNDPTAMAAIMSLCWAATQAPFRATNRPPHAHGSTSMSIGPLTTLLECARVR
jgi:hypothetical protein